MPASLNGSYRSLTGSNDVYRSTTVSGAQNTGTGLLDGVKKAFNFVSGTSSREERLIERTNTAGPVLISSRYSIHYGETILLTLFSYFMFF